MRVLLLAASLPAALAFGVSPAAPLRSSVAARSQQPFMGSPAAVANKAKTVEGVKESMDSAAMMFCVRTGGITANDMNMMRQKFEEDVKISCVKNTLVKRAAEDFPKFQGGDELLEYSNYWFFVPESGMRGAVDTWNDWVAETKSEENAIVGGMFDGTVLDGPGVTRIAKLPTKQELMQQTAVLLKALPTKLARGMKEAQGSKMARAVKALETKMGEEA